MEDTSDQILQIQKEIFQKKSPGERFLLGVAWIDLGWLILENKIRREHPEWSPNAIKVEIFSRCYADSIDPEVMTAIVRFLTEPRGRK